MHPTPSRTRDLLSSVDETVEKSVGIAVTDLTALFLLMSIRGFGPQKFKELHTSGFRAADIVKGDARLPMTGKRGDSFRAELETVVEKQGAICEQRAQRQIAAAYKHNCVILTYSHAAYPQTVFESNYPVPIIYARGSLEVIRNHNAVACVGSRQIRSPYAELHKAFVRTACGHGFVIVSGFALGADTIGHRAALGTKGQTVCVMPNGLDRPFPPENKPLWGELLVYPGAALVSELPFGTSASSLTLRKRNKLIVAFARGVLISQSSVEGGAMNAYRFAVEQRKPVATFRGDDSSDTSGNGLIEQELRPASMVFPSPNADSSAYESWLRLLSSSI